MKTTQNTILVTGGSAGIGYEIAKLFSEKGNHVIITGRGADRLLKTAATLKNVMPLVSDISNENDVDRLVATLENDFPALNMVINNAGRALVYNLLNENANAFENARDEIFTNYLSVIRLNEKLLPLLKKQAEAAIVNVSSTVAFVPGVALATYSASKAALHSYSQSLRYVLEREQTKVSVFELMPPLVNTEFSKEIGGERGISPVVVAEELLSGLANNVFEIHVGQTAQMYQVLRSTPEKAMYIMNGSLAV